MSTKPLQVYFTGEERKLLGEISVRAKRSESEMVRWLVEEYAGGRLVSAVEIDATKLRHEFVALVDQVERIKKRLGGAIPDAGLPEPAEILIDGLEAGSSISEKSQSRSQRAK